MIIKRIKLRNIRSYEDSEIVFPEGSVLLSGDIGAGKSTILMALEFALFGVKSESPATALLRKGKRQGYVELEFEIDNKKVIIKRGLKQSNNRISQTNGYIIIDGVKKEYAPGELKSFIIKLLGYPEELQRKKKSLIYRFTVYTPQEEMKRILFESREERLNTLRKVFGIDKYKRIKENASIILGNIKTRIKEETVRSERIDELKTEIKNLEEEETKLNKLREEVKERVLEEQKRLNQEQKKLNALNEELKNLILLKQELDITRKGINEKQEIIEDVKQKIKLLEEELKKLEGVDVEEIKKKQELKESIGLLEKEIRELQNQITRKKTEKESLLREKQGLELELKELMNELKLLKEKKDEKDKVLVKIEELKEQTKNKEKVEGEIKRLKEETIRLRSELKNTEDRIKTLSTAEKCPVCYQDIKGDYKEKLISGLTKKKEELTGKIKEEEKLIKEKEEEFSSIKEKEDEYQKLMLKLSGLNEALKNANKTKDLALKKKERINEINTKLKGMSSEEEEEKVKSLEEKLASLKKELDNILESEKALEKKKGLERQILELKERTKKLSEELESLKKREEELLKNIEEKRGIEELLKQENERIELINKALKEKEIELAKINKEIEFKREMIEKLNKELKEKELSLKKLEKLKELRFWIEEHFIKLVDLIEKQVMMRIHSEFNDLFQEWFNTLIEEETMNARLDEDFTPIVIQNGYEIEIENLSGGEKTSLALAYRLALNKVINDLTSQIKTKDLIILDEPTDGFSEQQLDKVRDVIKALNMKQVIIVSHEQKIESFVDNIIRIVKEEGVSKVVNH